MANLMYEVVFYLGKFRADMNIRKFNTLEEASSNLIASMGKYMQSESFLLNTDSSYCITVWDLHSDRMIQLLGPINDDGKRLVNDAFNVANKVPFIR